ncbi:MAG: hypothetical protein KDC34_07390 [Saprospiraceae bacterium]|nr:hypothetical protein [Saprospiraceae bacterium]
MKGRIYTLALLMMFGAATQLQAQEVEKTLVQSLNPGTNYAVSFDMSGPVEIIEWNDPVIRIQTTIRLHNATDTILRSLVQAGRYSPKGVSNEGLYEVSIPALAKQVTVGGQELQESFSYIIYVPRGLDVELPEEAAASYKR